MRYLFLLVVWAACGGARPDAVTLPRRLSATPAAAREPAEALTVTLTADGRLVAEGRSRTLDALSELVRGRAQKKIWHPLGLEVAALVCRLRIDASARWQHVAWLLTVLAEAKVWRVRFVLLDGEGGEAGLAWSLPVESSHLREPPYLEVLLLKVTVGEEGRVRCGTHASTERQAFTRFLAEQHARIAADGLDVFAAEITPDGRARWGAVVAVLEQLLAAGAERVDFGTGRYVPWEEHRDRDPLPEPEPGTRGVGAGGVTLCGAWRDDGQLMLELLEEEIPEENGR